MTIHWVSLWLGKNVDLEELWQICGQTWDPSKEDILLEAIDDIFDSFGIENPRKIYNLLDHPEVWAERTSKWDAAMIPHDQVEMEYVSKGFIFGVQLLTEKGISILSIQKAALTVGFEARLFLIQDDCHCCK